MVGVELHGDHQREPDQDSRDDAAEEQSADRDLCDRPVDDHGHAGRDDRPDGAGGRDQGGGKSGLVAGLLHGRDDDRADRRRVRGGRARHAGDRHAGHDRRMREAGAEMADQRAREIDQLLADAAGRHDRSGQDEIGHRQQREGIELPEHLLREQRHHELGQHRDPDEADQGDAKQDRNPDQHRPEKKRQQEGDHGAVGSGGGSGGGSPAMRRENDEQQIHASDDHPVIGIAHRDLEPGRYVASGDERDAVAVVGGRDREAGPQELDHQIEDLVHPERVLAPDRLDGEMRAAPVGDRDCQEDEPDMPEDLDLLAPARRRVQHEAAEDLEEADQHHAGEDRRHQDLDGPVNRRKDCFHASPANGLLSNADSCLGRSAT